MLLQGLNRDVAAGGSFASFSPGWRDITAGEVVCAQRKPDDFYRAVSVGVFGRMAAVITPVFVG